MSLFFTFIQGWHGEKDVEMEVCIFLYPIKDSCNLVVFLIVESQSHSQWVVIPEIFFCRLLAQNQSVGIYQGCSRIALDEGDDENAEEGGNAVLMLLWNPRILRYFIFSPTLPAQSIYKYRNFLSPGRPIWPNRLPYSPGKVGKACGNSLQPHGPLRRRCSNLNL